MREVEVNGKKYRVRSIKNKERTEHALGDFGYGRFFYSPPSTADGNVDQEKAEQGIDKVIDLILSAEARAEIDESGGIRALAAVHLAIIKETYGAKDEEKNSLSSGAGPQTESA